MEKIILITIICINIVRIKFIVLVLCVLQKLVIRGNEDICRAITQKVLIINTLIYEDKYLWIGTKAIILDLFLKEDVVTGKKKKFDFL